MELIDKLAPRSTALLVVDMQNDYCHENGALAQNGTDVTANQRIVPRLKSFIGAARGAGVHVIFIRTTHDETTDSEVRRALPRFEKMYLCRTGSWGAEYYGVSPDEQDTIVTKHRYSAFINTPLDLILRSGGMRSVVVTGVATHVCVDCTARDAFQRDLFTVVVSDCTATANPQLHKATLENFQRHFGDVVTADDVERVWCQQTSQHQGG